VNNQNSPLEQVTTGVPQGSLLGPGLFTTTANDLPENIPSGNSELFADDTTCYAVGNNHQEVFAKLSNILLELTSWANKNGFTIHTSKGKTEIMFLSKRKFIGPLPAFKLGSANINVTESVKCLVLIRFLTGQYMPRK